MYLLKRIERYLKRRGVRPSTFGREAINDPRFVRDLRNGREPRSETEAKVVAYLARCERRGDHPCSR